MDDRDARATQLPDGGRLLRRVEDVVAIEVLLDLEDGVDALRWDVALSRLLEEQRAEVGIVNHEVDLVASMPVGVDDEGIGDGVAAREEAVATSAIESSCPVDLA